MTINTDASGLFEYKGTLQSHSGKLTWARQHATAHYTNATSHFSATAWLILFHTKESLELSALHAEGSHSNQWLT